MTRTFAMMVCIARPQWFVMENVPQVARLMLGTMHVLCWYGVPQSRKRLFVIGRLGERDGFLASALVVARTKPKR